MPPSPLIPNLRYTDPNAAVDYLQSVLGFTEHQVFRDDADQVAHAELRLGDAIIMVSPALDTPFGQLMKLPTDIGGFNTQALYLITDNADAVHARVRQANWALPIDIQDKPYGGRDFTCRDPGCHLWSIGTYSPWTKV